MVNLVKSSHLFDVVYGDLINIDEENKTIIFSRQGLIFVFNFHVSYSIPDYSFPVPEPGDYRLILNSDNPEFGGHSRLDEKLIHTTLYNEECKTHSLSIYNTNRTAQVFARIA
jgi:1,4-alpha-glucan branching enzyme